MSELLVNKLIDHLKFEINYFQSEALSASSASDEGRCRKALQSQSYAIDCLIKAVDAKRRILMRY
ncbi:hypothetical protein HA62_10880 [Pseudomonas putida]|nr:hypothetical protein HA62_10880 [Pseudomonas putida]